jgi:hypothetical protein
MIRLVVALLASIPGLVLMVPVVLLILPCWIVSILVRQIERRLAKQARPWDWIIQYEPEIGWKQVPNLNGSYADRNGDRCTVRTDAEGWPGTHGMQESDVLVFGDSFAFGYGVDVSDAYYAQSRTCRIKSVGSPGYNMVQALLWMRRYADRLRGKLVVWFICTENDLVENLKPHTSDFYPTPFLRACDGSADWEIVSSHVRPRKSQDADDGVGNVTLFAHLCTKCPYSERVYAAAHHLIQEARSLCEAQEARLLVLSIPFKMQLHPAGVNSLRGCLRDAGDFDPKYPDKMLSGICAQLGVAFVAGTEELVITDYKERDGHWNCHGNRKVATLIEDHYRSASRVRLPFPASPHSGAEVVRSAGAC